MDICKEIWTSRQLVLLMDMGQHWDTTSNTPMNLPLKLTYPPIEMPVIPRGQYPSLSSQRRSAVDSRMRAPPITNRSDTFFRLDRLKRPQKAAAKWIQWAPRIPHPLKDKHSAQSKSSMMAEKNEAHKSNFSVTVRLWDPAVQLGILWKRCDS